MADLPTLATNMASAITLANRTYRVAYKRVFNGTGLDWRLYTYGPGHWCIGEGHSGSFRTEAEAVAAGEAWVETGGASQTAGLVPGEPERPLSSGEIQAAGADHAPAPASRDDSGTVERIAGQSCERRMVA